MLFYENSLICNFSSACNRLKTFILSLGKILRQDARLENAIGLEHVHLCFHVARQLVLLIFSCSLPHKEILKEWIGQEIFRTQLGRQSCRVLGRVKLNLLQNCRLLFVILPITECSTYRDPRHLERSSRKKTRPTDFCTYYILPPRRSSEARL